MNFDNDIYLWQNDGDLKITIKETNMRLQQGITGFYLFFQGYNVDEKYRVKKEFLGKMMTACHQELNRMAEKDNKHGNADDAETQTTKQPEPYSASQS